MSPLLLVTIKLAAVALPLAALARGLRIYPSTRLVVLVLVPGLTSFVLLALPRLIWPLAVLDVLVASFIVGDLWTLPRARSFAVERRAGHIASLRQRHAVELAVSNLAARSYWLEIRDGAPHVLNPHPAEFAQQLDGRSRVFLEYAMRPSRRGAFTLTHIHLRARSRLRLWVRYLDYGCPTSINVYPDMKQLREYALLARTNRLRLVGVRRTRRIGQDHDFERLRDFGRDDNFKHIDWRATARRQKLTVKDFQASQSQRLVFLIDCGRMMTNEAAGLSLLDHALNAMLMLSYVALRQGDSVGLITFSDAVHNFVPVRGGMAQMNRLLHAVFDRYPQFVESRYDQAFRYVASHCRRRSLVVLVTNVIDEVNAHQVDRYLTSLVGRHLPLAVLLRDRRLFEAAETIEPHGDRLWQAAAAAEILTWRHQVLADLTSKGALALDLYPEEMTAPLVNRYLEIKARHLL